MPMRGTASSAEAPYDTELTLEEERDALTYVGIEG